MERSEATRHERTTLQLELVELRRAFAKQSARDAWIVAAVVAVCAGVAALGLGVVAPASNGWVLRAVVLLATVCVSAVFYLRRRAAFASDEAVAARIEAFDPSYRNDVRAALEFAQRPAASETTARALRARLTDRVRERVHGDPHLKTRAAPRLEPAGANAALVSAIALLALMAAAAPTALERSFDELLGDLSRDDGVAEGAALGAPNDAAQRPIVSALDVRVTPPLYTNARAQVLNGSTGDFLVLAGSDVRIEGRTLEPASSLQVTLDDGTQPRTIELELGLDGRFSGSFPIVADTNYRFLMRTPDDELVADPILRRVDAMADEPPIIRLREPTENLEVTPGVMVDFDYTVSDEFGVTAVEFVWYFAGDEDDPRTLPLLGELEGREQDDLATFDTGPLMLQAGDEVIVLIEARDNNVVTGPGVGRSRPISLRIAAADEKYEAALVLKEELFEALLQQLGAILTNRFEGGEGASDVSDSESQELLPRVERFAAAGTIHGAWPGILSRFNELVTLVTEDELSSPREATLLAGARDNLVGHVTTEASLLDRFDLVNVDAITREDEARLAATRGPMEHDVERTILVLEELIASQKADAVSRALEELTATRDRLRELMQTYSETEDPMLREQIERELERLAARTQELLARLAEQVEELPWEHVNQDAMEPSEAAQEVTTMQDSMSAIQERLNAGDVDGALEALDQMSASLDALNDELGDPMAGADSTTLSEFDQEMGEVMDDVAALEAQEDKLQEDSEALEEEWRAAREAEMRDELEAALTEARREIAGARAGLQELDARGLPQHVSERARLAEASLRAVAERLDARDIAASEDAARRAISDLNDAAMAMRMVQRYGAPGTQARENAAEGTRASAQGAGAASRVADAMAELIRSSQPRPGSGAAEAMEGLAERQRGIEEGLDGLAERLGEMGERFPMMEGQFGEGLGEVREGMQQSQRGLRQRSMRPAREGQGQAIQGLGGLRQQLQQQMSRQRQQEQRAGGGRQNEPERVEIPEDSRASRAGYRDQVMEAMREGSLEAYDQDIRRYYESLVE